MHPMAPPGSKIIIHTKPANRSSWAFHGVQGSYIAPSLQHYRCVRCYVPTTRSELISNTIKFLPEYIPIPNATIEDYIKATLEKILTTMQSQDKVKSVHKKSNSNQDLLKSYRDTQQFSYYATNKKS